MPSDEVTEVIAGYRGPEVCKIAGITYRQLDHWARTDLLRPSVSDAAGSGTQRLYSYHDLVELRTIKKMLDAGISLARARTAISYLREQLGQELAAADLVIRGKDSILVRDREETIDLLRKGQGVMSFVPLDDVKHEVDSAIRELRPAVGDTETGAPSVSVAN